MIANDALNLLMKVVIDKISKKGNSIRVWSGKRVWGQVMLGSGKGQLSSVAINPCGSALTFSTSRVGKT